MNVSVLVLVLSTVVAVNALMLIGLVLIQQSKGGGFGTAFGGAGESVFGAHMTNHLTKLTVVLTSTFFLLTLVLAIIIGRREAPLSAVEREASIEEAPIAFSAEMERAWEDEVFPGGIELAPVESAPEAGVEMEVVELEVEAVPEVADTPEPAVPEVEAEPATVADSADVPAAGLPGAEAESVADDRE